MPTGIYQLPLGVIGIAIGVVLLPELARALGAGEQKTALTLQNRSLEFGLGLTVPAAVALALTPVPFIAVIYERGAFLPKRPRRHRAALAAFAVGLPSFVLIKVLQPAYFAREDMKTPMWFSLVSLIVNAGGSLAMFPLLGHVGIARQPASPAGPTRCCSAGRFGGAAISARRRKRSGAS
jgi:putative peptidoglycan lipid II flippase